MRAGRTLQQVLATVKEQESQKRDWIADTSALEFMVDGDELSGHSSPRLFMHGNSVSLRPTTWFHGQVSERVKIPRQYYNRMLTEAPSLLASNVNHWFRSQPQRRMVRALGETARAFLSERYRPFDNLAVARAVLPVLGEMGPNVKFVSCEVTENRLYLKASFPSVQAEVKRGDVVESGIMVSNSEVGVGATEVLPYLTRLICNNGAVCDEFGTSRRHVGRILGRGGDGGDEGEAYDLFRDETLRLDEEAYTAKLRDVVRATVDEEKFKRIVEAAREATEDRWSGKGPNELVEEVTAKFGVLQESDADPLLRYLCEGGDLSRWGVANAITRLSQDVEDYDRATNLERVGGRLLTTEEGKKLWASLN